MSVGSILAFGTSVFLAIQAYFSKAYRWLLSVLSFSIFLAGYSLCSAVVLFNDFTFRHTFFVLFAGLLSYLVAMYSLVILYRPNFKRRYLLFTACLAFSGYAIWSGNLAARNWSTVCQFTMTLVTLTLVANAKDELAPSTHWLTIGLCLFGAFGLLPRMLTILNTGMTPTEHISFGSASYRIRSLIWAISPIVVYAVVTGVIHARIAERLKRAIDLDMLTGAHSRRFLFERGQEMLERRTPESASSLSVLLIDVDHFKHVNDHWGHAVGDEVLIHIVRQIENVVRGSDSVIARYGGEEFVVLVPTPNTEVANRIAERIRTYVKEHPYQAPNIQLPLTISIGIAMSRGSDTLYALIHQADECLYRAKHAGRDQVVFQSDLSPVA